MKRDETYLVHIRDAVDRITAYTHSGKDAFLGDPKTQDAVLRNLEIIGEATKSLSDELRSAHPGIRWKQIAGMRDKLIHEYFGVNLNLVWQVVQEDVPKLRHEIDDILGD